MISIVQSYQSGPTAFMKESDRLPEPSRSSQLHDSTLHFTQADHRTSPGTERPDSPQVSGFNSGNDLENSDVN